MGMIRNYCIIRDEVAEHFGVPTVVTFTGRKGDYYPFGCTKIIQLSDYVIQCDQDGRSYYIKNRQESHHTAVVDPEYLVWVKLASVEMEG